MAINSAVAKSFMEALEMDLEDVASYATCIALAFCSIDSALDRGLSTKEIYNYMAKQTPSFVNHHPKWKSGVRHCLSSNKAFERKPTLYGTLTHTWLMRAECLPAATRRHLRHLKSMSDLKRETAAASAALKNQQFSPSLPQQGQQHQQPPHQQRHTLPSHHPQQASQPSIALMKHALPSNTSSPRESPATRSVNTNSSLTDSADYQAAQLIHALKESSGDRSNASDMGALTKDSLASAPGLTNGTTASPSLRANPPQPAVQQKLSSVASNMGMNNFPFHMPPMWMNPMHMMPGAVSTTMPTPQHSQPGMNPAAAMMGNNPALPPWQQLLNMMASGAMAPSMELPNSAAPMMMPNNMHPSMLMMQQMGQHQS
ncbi:uncharacterized protein MONBRDRAFT_27373 [Monosiga brevicollis MX1]|uniref:Fork-head domain-containing protein n=1 Tax=Monosiga brevicollis TaxID=81824 RepID=A9V536_MONBE|nr:uncharacterized protein MONBRDRAFT_27373 [Monosiga brevicollis MX1]EDQ87311.1 predicted protein [Monosiga brevicollis MX1]|eukprot:XP_001747924.1 hypothetical protein [Monosiga brevicollis MX1]